MQAATNHNKLLLLCFMLMQIVVPALADHYYFRIQFKDKKNSPYSMYSPSAFLSEKALVRRGNYWIHVDSTDLPVNPAYVNQVAATGVDVRFRSRWLNNITILTTDSSVMAQIRNFSFVKEVEYTGKITSAQPAPRKNKFSGINYNYGSANTQITQLNGQFLHQQGSTGEGVVIAVLDAGFKNVNINPAFDSLRFYNRILGTKNFTYPAVDVYTTDNHGAHVLSVMGAHLPGQYVGTAPKASYWLLQTEYAPSEFLYEVDAWVAGAEFADSVGADIINSSLGYTEFDDSTMNYTYADMNGQVSRASIAATLASAKGIIVCNSAGNSGNTAWKFIGAPADARDILTVGAVNGTGTIASFSSWGPSADNRVKPEVCAMGSATALVSVSGSVIYGNGTSFSSPVIAGITASYLEFFRSQTYMFTPFSVRHGIINSADRYFSPDNRYGYGLPDFSRAIFSVPTGYYASKENTRNQIIFIPETKELLIKSNDSSELHTVKIIAMNGRSMGIHTISDKIARLNLTGLPKGMYMAMVNNGQTTESLKFIIQ
jgi:hypothetical protein